MFGKEKLKRRISNLEEINAIKEEQVRISEEKVRELGELWIKHRKVVSDNKKKNIKIENLESDIRKMKLNEKVIISEKTQDAKEKYQTDTDDMKKKLDEAEKKAAVLENENKILKEVAEGIGFSVSDTKEMMKTMVESLGKQGIVKVVK